MKVAVVYTTKSKNAKTVISEMAKCARTYARHIDDFSYTEAVDLLIVGFDTELFEEKELLEFIQSLDRRYVKNVALVNSFYLSQKYMDKIVELCQKQYLPLMRQQYQFKMTINQRKEIHPTIINNARIYIEDLMTIIRKYY